MVLGMKAIHYPWRSVEKSMEPEGETSSEGEGRGKGSERERREEGRGKKKRRKAREATRRTAFHLRSIVFIRDSPCRVYIVL